MTARAEAGRGALVVAAALAFLLLGGPVVRERAERAALAPIAGLAAAAALFPQVRTRRGAAVAGGLAGLALLASAAGHVALVKLGAARWVGLNVAIGAAFYLGPLLLVAGLYAAARRAGGRALAIPLAAAFAAFYVPAKAMVHRPKVISPIEASAAGEPAGEEATLATRDGLRLAATYFPAPPTATAAAGGRTPALIVAHGVSANRGAYFRSYPRLARSMGYASLMLDFRGHGESDGFVQTFGAREVEDVRAAAAWLRARPEIDPGRIAILGHSMGGAIAIIAAADLPEIRAVVADAPYDDFRGTAARRLRFGFLPAAAGRALAEASFALGQLETGIDARTAQPILAVGRIAPRPVLFVHGDADTATSPDCSRRLYDAAGEPRELLILPGVKHGRHLDLFPPEYRARVAAFLARAFASN